MVHASAGGRVGDLRERQLWKEAGERAVNAVLASSRRWEADADGLIRQIKSSPVIDLTDDLKVGDPRTETA